MLALGSRDVDDWTRTLALLEESNRRLLGALTPFLLLSAKSEPFAYPTGPFFGVFSLR